MVLDYCVNQSNPYHSKNVKRNQLRKITPAFVDKFPEKKFVAGSYICNKCRISCGKHILEGKEYTTLLFSFLINYFLKKWQCHSHPPNMTWLHNRQLRKRAASISNQMRAIGPTLKMTLHMSHQVNKELIFINIYNLKYPF